MSAARDGGDVDPVSRPHGAAGRASEPRGAAASGPASAAVLLSTLHRQGMTHLVGLPDNGSARLFAAAAADPNTTLLTVTREGEAFAIASGLWLGGACPVVSVQNTGLLESGDGLRGTALRMGAPLLVLVGVRGHAKMVAYAGEIERDRDAGRLAAHTFKRADIDSVAPMTAPTLQAWGVPWVEYAGDGDAPLLVEAWRRARRDAHPVAVLLPRDLQ